MLWAGVTGTDCATGCGARRAACEGEGEGEGECRACAGCRCVMGIAMRAMECCRQAGGSGERSLGAGQAWCGIGSGQVRSLAPGAGCPWPDAGRESRRRRVARCSAGQRRVWMLGPGGGQRGRRAARGREGGAAAAAEADGETGRGRAARQPFLVARDVAIPAFCSSSGRTQNAPPRADADAAERPVGA